MKKLVISISTIIIILGIILFVTGMSLLNWNFLNLDTENLEYNTVRTSENITKINITTNFNLRIIDNNSSDFAIRYFESEQIIAEFRTTGNVLAIEVTRASWSWRANFGRVNGLRTSRQEIIVSVPNHFDGTINVESTSGRVIVEELTFNTLNINVRSGRVSLTGLAINNLEVVVRSGNISLDQIGSDKIALQTNSGRVMINEVSSLNTVIEVSSGNIEIDQVNTNTLDVATRSGRINLNDITANVITLETRSGVVSGNINGSIHNFNIAVRIRSGRSNISNQTPTWATNSLSVTVNSGNINLSFNQ